MRLRRTVCCALFAAALVVPSAVAAPQLQGARPARKARTASIAEGVATAIAAEIVKSGIKAAVAQWAPDLTKYVDPVAHGLAQIEAKLEEIDRKLTQLIDEQQALEQHLNCVVQRTALDHSLSEARAWFARLRGTARTTDLAEREKVFERLFAQYDAMVADQDHLHQALIGSDGLIRACAKHIQSGMRPYLSAQLAIDVNNFYDVYRTAATELLILRSNMIAFHPGQFGPTEAQETATHLEGWWKAEASWIKPSFPPAFSYDTTSGWLWQYTTVPYWNISLRGQLEAVGWRITGYSTTPTCSAVEAFVKQSGRTGSAALAYLHKLYVISIPPGDSILCYDDSDRIHDFNLATFHYTYAGNYTSNQPSVAAKPNNGSVNISSYSY
jgi:hypothetical protein